MRLRLRRDGHTATLPPPTHCSAFPMFDPSHPSFWMVDPPQQRGVHCRFGMPGIIAESHYDQGEPTPLFRRLMTHLNPPPRLQAATLSP